MEGENFGESMILKLLARKNLANLPAVDQKVLLVSRLAASAFHLRARRWFSSSTRRSVTVIPSLTDDILLRWSLLLLKYMGHVTRVLSTPDVQPQYIATSGHDTY